MKAQLNKKRWDAVETMPGGELPHRMQILELKKYLKLIT